MHLVVLIQTVAPQCDHQGDLAGRFLRVRDGDGGHRGGDGGLRELLQVVEQDGGAHVEHVCALREGQGLRETVRTGGRPGHASLSEGVTITLYTYYY